MFRKMTRRQIISAGAASSGILFGAGCESTPPQETLQVQEPKGPGREPFWGPGPNKNLYRDLTPGTTPVRLAGYLTYRGETTKMSDSYSVEGGKAGRESIGETVRKIRESGITSVVAGFEPWCSIEDSVVRELRDALEQHDVVIFEMGGYRNIIHTDKKERQENCKHLARCIEAADRIGCPMVGTISGSRNPEGNKWGDNYAVHPDNWTMETWNLLLDSIRQILKDTEGMKAVIGMEAQITTNIDGPLAHRRLMDDVGNARLKTNLDPTNMIHLYNHFHTTGLINECFDLLGEDIMGCHAKDSYVLPHSQTVHVQEVCPGRGSLDYETYLVRISRMNWSRSLLPEHIPADQFDESYSYIRKVAAQVGVKIYGDAS